MAEPLPKAPRNRLAGLPRWLMHPATLLLLASDLLPIVGLLLWSWDAFLILMLYWMETAIIGFWTILRIATLPRAAMAAFPREGGRVWAAPAMALFFVFHAGIFMLVHFMFLWGLFAGGWERQVHGVVGFVNLIVVATGLWIPLLFLFAGRLIWFLTELTGWNPYAAVQRFLCGRAVLHASSPADPMVILTGFYARIVLMQFAIIIGGMLAVALGSVGPLIVMIAIRTALDALTLSAAPRASPLRLFSLAK
jgi:Family of unknown function (DUF6498)